MKFDVVIIGAGINGLATAYHLSRHKKLKVGIIEQFEIGNVFGGSHGTSRITRSSYTHPAYIKLMHRAHVQEWPRLEKEMACKFIYPNSGCFFGSGKKFERYIQELSTCGLDIEILEIDAARQLFPQFTFNGTNAVIHDRTGGVIAAQELITALKKALIQQGVVLLEHTKVSNIDSHSHPIQIITDKGTFLTERLVITAGAWVGNLVPELRAHIAPIRQTVAYVTLRGPRELYQLGQFPTWACIGDGDNQIFYGLPEFGCEGIKISQHITQGIVDNPDQKVITGNPDKLEILKQFIQNNFVQPIEHIIKTETCLYANTPREDFIIDFLPHDKRIVIGSVCSGHGFKFAPLTGLIVSELVLEGKTTVTEFEDAKSMFTLKAP